MKKYILILFLLFSGLANAQWATPDRLPHTTVVNTGTFYGKGAGTVNAPIQMIVSPGATIDTASWRFVGSGGDGSNKVMVNRVTYLGRAAGTVYATLVYPVNSTSSYSTTESDTRFLHSADSLKYVYKRDSLTTFVTPAMMNNEVDTLPQLTKSLNIFTKKMVVGTGISNSTNDFLVMGDSTTIRGTVLRDSSMFRVEVNPFSQRLKVSMIGKLGTNMLTVDSANVSTTLPIIADFYEATSSGSGFKSSSSGYFFWNNSSLINAPNNGTVRITNFAGTSFVNFQVGAGNFTAGFIRGTVDTDITAPYCRSPNGTLWYILVSDAGLITASTTAP